MFYKLVSLQNRSFETTDTNNLKNYYSTCFTNSNIKHKFKNDKTSLIILINPISSIGHQLSCKYRYIQITSLHADLEKLSDIFN